MIFMLWLAALPLRFLAALGCAARSSWSACSRWP